MSPKICSKSFGTFKKQAPGPDHNKVLLLCFIHKEKTLRNEKFLPIGHVPWLSRPKNCAFPFDVQGLVAEDALNPPLPGHNIYAS